MSFQHLSRPTATVLDFVHRSRAKKSKDPVTVSLDSPVMGALEASVALINGRANALAEMEVKQGKALVRKGVAAIGLHASPQDALQFLKELVRNLEIGAEQP